MKNLEIYKTNSPWCYWYHNPVDKKWDLASYTKIYEFDNLNDYCLINNSWDDCLPSVSEGMFFLMRKIDDNTYINPLWEDTYNREGGFWSFKLNKEKAIEVWNILCDYLVSENITKSKENSLIINGISISPKRNFCIIKIWNNTTKMCDKSLLNQNINSLSYDECMYKCHNDNIANDRNKMTNKKDKNRVFKK